MSLGRVVDMLQGRGSRQILETQALL